MSGDTEQQAPADDSESMLRYYGLIGCCHAGQDGECTWSQCPQLRDGEPEKSHRHCPLDNREEF